MKELEFKKRFQAAACFCRDFTQKHIIEELPSSLRFNFGLSERKQPTKNNKYSFNNKEFTLAELEGINATQAFNFLFTKQGVPIWIDFYVESFDKEHTYLETTFSNEFTEDDSILFNQNKGLPPFHIIGPTIPEAGWRSLKEDGKFNFIHFF
jgi:hypothetical protein